MVKFSSFARLPFTGLTVPNPSKCIIDWAQRESECSFLTRHFATGVRCYIWFLMKSQYPGAFLNSIFLQTNAVRRSRENRFFITFNEQSREITYNPNDTISTRILIELIIKRYLFFNNNKPRFGVYFGKRCSFTTCKTSISTLKPHKNLFPDWLLTFKFMIKLHSYRIVVTRSMQCIFRQLQCVQGEYTSKMFVAKNVSWLIQSNHLYYFCKSISKSVKLNMERQ